MYNEPKKLKKADMLLRRNDISPSELKRQMKKLKKEHNEFIKDNPSPKLAINLFTCPVCGAVYHMAFGHTCPRAKTENTTETCNYDKEK